MSRISWVCYIFFFQAEDGIRDGRVTGVQTCALPIWLRPLVEDDLAMFRRFATEPGLIGLDWAGFRDAGAPARRFATDGYLGADDGRLMVEVEEEHVAAGFVSWMAGLHGGVAKHWEIGIALLPEWRGRGIGWRAQAMLCDYLFCHTPAQRIQAGTHPENIPQPQAPTQAPYTSPVPPPR